MSAYQQPAEAGQETNGAGRRQSTRSRRPAPKVVELCEREIAAQEAYEETLALATSRAEKRPRDYTLDELEELIAKRRKENEVNIELQSQRTSNPAPPPPPQYAHSGVNLDFVSRVRSRATNQTTDTATHATNHNSNADPWHPAAMTQPAAMPHSHRPAQPIANLHPFQAPNQQDLPLIDDPELDQARSAHTRPLANINTMNPLLDSSRCPPSGLPPSTSPSPNQHSTCSTNPNNDPNSTTYGDGPGDLLPPRRLTVRSINPEDMKSKDKKGRKAAYNQLRKELALAEACWDWARQFHHKRITHDKGIIALLRRNLVNHRTQLSSVSTDLVTEYYRFNRTSHPNKETRAANTTQANRVLKDSGYIFGDLDSRDDPYETGLILELGTRLWFDGKHTAGVLHPDLFLPTDGIPVVTLAYIVTILEKAIKEWVPGIHKCIPLTSDSHRDRLQYHINEIKKYREYPGAEDLYRDIVKDLNTAFRNKVNEFIPEPVEAADDTPGITNTGGGGSGGSAPGLRAQDIEKAIHRRRAKIAGNASTPSPTTNVVPSHPLHVPPEASALQGSPVVNNNMRLHLPPGFVLPFSNSDESELRYMERTGSTVSTIYPEDSVSQQVQMHLVESAYGAAQGDHNVNEEQMGFLVELEGPL